MMAQPGRDRPSDRLVMLVYRSAYPPGSGPPGAEHCHDRDGFLFLELDQGPPAGFRCVLVAIFELRAWVEVEGPRLILESPEEIPPLSALKSPAPGRDHRYVAGTGLHPSPGLPPTPGDVFAIAEDPLAETMGIRLVRRFDPPVRLPARPSFRS